MALCLHLWPARPCVTGGEKTAWVLQILKIQKDLDSTQEVLHSTIESILSRGTSDRWSHDGLDPLELAA